MKFTLDNFTPEAQDVELFHKKYGQTGAYITLRPVGSPEVVAAASAPAETDTEKLARAFSITSAAVVSWPEESNEFFYGQAYSESALNEVLTDPRSQWVMGFIMGAIADAENFIAPELRKLVPQSGQLND